jgi:outer membrane protein OmpA-like peptidoglycan-associated protein
MVERMKKITLAIILFGFVVSLTSCAYQNKQQKGTAVGAGVGAAAGAVIGQAIGRDTESTLLGAAIGAAVGGLAGNQIGAYMDRQEQALRDALAASEAASIQRNQDVLTATFKSDVYFKFDSATLLPGGQREMDRVASVLNQYPQTTIRVEGHTDATGTEEYNLQLSERRARAVADALVQRNVYPERISTVGFGESQLISSDPATNRRVNIVIEPIRRG